MFQSNDGYSKCIKALERGGLWMVIKKFSASPKLSAIKRDIFGIESCFDVEVANSFFAKDLKVCILWEQILIWNENNELHSFKDVLSKHRLLTLVHGSYSNVPLVSAKFFLCINI